MPIAFCQLLEKAVDRNDISAVTELCAAYQTISKIAFSNAEFINLPSAFLSLTQHAACMAAAKNKPQILALLTKLQTQPQINALALADAKHQKIPAVPHLELLFKKYERAKEWQKFTELWRARCQINMILTQYFSQERLTATQEINYYFPYLIVKAELIKITSEFVENWYTDKCKYSDDYIRAVLSKVKDSEMLAPQVMIDVLQKLTKKPNADKNTFLTVMIQEFQDCFNQVRVAIYNDQCTQDLAPHAENAIKAIQALKLRFEFIKFFLSVEKYHPVVVELYEDVQRLPNEYKQYDEGGQLENIAQLLSKAIIVKSASDAAKAPKADADSKAIDAKTAAYCGPLPGLSPTLAALTATAAKLAEEVEIAAFADVLGLVTPYAASAGNTPIVSPTLTPSNGTLFAITPGGPA